MNESQPAKKPSQRKPLGKFAIAFAIVFHLVGFLAIVCMVFFVIPNFENMFEEFGLELSALTRFVLTMNNQITKLAFLAIPMIMTIQAVTITLLCLFHQRKLLYVVHCLLVLSLALPMLAFSTDLIAIVRGLSN